MKSKSPKFLPVLCVLVAGVLGLAAWLFLGDEPPRIDHVVDAAEVAEPKADAPRMAGDVVALPAKAPAVPASEPAPAPEAQEGERKTAATAADLELAAGIWVSGRIVYPDGTPIDESAEVVANGRKFKTHPMHRVKVEPNGTFRVAFAPGTRTGKLELDARYLFLKSPEAVKLAGGASKEELVLEPLLGGCLRGQLVLPPEGLALAAELTGKSVSTFGWDSNFDGVQNRTAKLDENLRFELRGLAPGMTHNLNFESGVVAALAVPELRVLAGQLETREFPMTLGVRIRGRVTCNGGTVPPNSVVSVQVEAEGDRIHMLGYGGGGGGTAKIEADGSFDARGMQPGKLVIGTVAQQRIAAKLELGLLADGDVRDGVELVLGMGESLGGRILWPDGKPAADAKVQITPVDPPHEEHGLAMVQIFGSLPMVRTDAEGAFKITGLTPGKYSVLAQAKPTGEKPKAGARQQSWKASVEEVAAGTLDMRLELVGGYAVSGVVVDDAGNPVPRFRVAATVAEDSERSFMPTTAASSSFKTEDGRFELPGFLEGEYQVVASGAGYEPSEPVLLKIPDGAGELRFVLSRRGSISGLVMEPDGTPAAKATVHAMTSEGDSWDTTEAKSNARGEFRLKSVPAGSLELWADLDGFSASERSPVQLAPGASASGVQLTLRVGGRITGQVVASRPGEELGGREVGAYGQEHGERAGGVTDASGGFVLEHLEPGDYDVWVSAPPGELARLQGGKPDMDWQLQEELKQHAQASVPDGGSVHVTIGTPVRAVVPFAGVVRRGNLPAPGVRVRCSAMIDEADQFVRFGMTDATGRFEVGLAGAGSYQVTLQMEGSEGTSITHAFEVPASGTKDVVLQIPGGRIAGKAVLPEGEKIEYLQFSLSYLGGSLSQAAVSPRSDYLEGDSFDFKDLPAGRYALKVEREVWWNRSEDSKSYVASREIVLGEGEQQVGIEIPLHLAASLKVLVAGADQGWIAIQRAGAGTSWDNHGFGEGECEIQSLDPGAYEVFVYSQPGLCSPRQRIEVVAGEASSLSVPMHAAGNIEVALLDAQGEAANGTARVFDSPGRSAGPWILDHGNSAMVVPGTYRVVAKSPAGVEVEASVEVRAGETAPVELRFP